MYIYVHTCIHIYILGADNQGSETKVQGILTRKLANTRARTRAHTRAHTHDTHDIDALWPT